MTGYELGWALIKILKLKEVEGEDLPHWYDKKYERRTRVHWRSAEYPAFWSVGFYKPNDIDGMTVSALHPVDRGVANSDWPFSQELYLAPRFIEMAHEFMAQEQALTDKVGGENLDVLDI